MKVMRLVFDAAEWRKTGDIGDNSQFWKPAQVKKIYRKDGDLLCDVIFEGDRLSTGHFWNQTNPIRKDTVHAS